ncbi:alpha/beta fold hydrolase [Wenzhouxiangella sp. AB-CW3]|uniref:esterase/lipase family protein n=1 Tax=Wenzhouxiangella sp. AB-CW3 TaxID=2771012 RepID=UPI00168BBD34|nr:alpha/beta fold hydrolase [Wenzhouxiangella sp. AB-CW3]QOC22738.1 alpha/beta fold hydrolase [Wenzhouxiangella sp. AB-CW3]
MSSPGADLAPSDLRGLCLLAADGVVEVSRVVEQLHHTIARVSLPVGSPVAGTTRGITGLVYRSVRTIAGVAGSGAGLVLGRFAPAVPLGQTRIGREHLLSVLNGILGDHLEAGANPLAIDMGFLVDGMAVDLDSGLPDELARQAGRKLLVSLHGLCLNEACWVKPDGDVSLPRTLAESHGYTPVYLRYNSGRHISANGAELAEKLQRLIEIWPEPVEEIVLLGHSMGGLIARSASHHATLEGRDWVNPLSSIICLGSPHHGAPLERIGHRLDRLLGVSPYSAPFARLGRLRSAGITDLRFGNLCREDWQDRDRFEPGDDNRQPVVHADHVRHYMVAATLDRRADSLRSLTIGDGLVPVPSALGQHDRPERQVPALPEHQLVVRRSGHVDLMSRRRVLRQLQHWLRTSAASPIRKA